MDHLFLTYTSYSYEQDWADGGVFPGRSDSFALQPPYGPAAENSAKGYAGPAEAVEAWYAKKSVCVPKSNKGCTGSRDDGANLFAAMVWQRAVAIGCGTKGQPHYLQVCHYVGADTIFDLDPTDERIGAGVCEVPTSLYTGCWESNVFPVISTKTEQECKNVAFTT